MTTFEVETDDRSRVVTEAQLEYDQSPVLHNDVLTVSDLVLRSPDRAQSMSSVIPTDQGIRLRIAVPGRHPDKVFWSTDGPRVEALLPHP